MTVKTTTYTVTYTGTGSQSVFSVPFEYFTDDDLLVTVDGVDTSFSYLAGDPRAGTATITVAGPPANGKDVVITRNIDLTQTAQYAAFGNYDGQSFEAGMDRMTMRIQQASGPQGNHELLSGLQGGTTGQHNHLTNAQVALVNASVSDHEDLSGIQGGTTGEHYHLTAAQVAAIGGGATGAIVSIYVYDAATAPSGSVQMTANVVSTGTIDRSIVWSVSDSSQGSVNPATGVYTAPSTPGTYTVWATSAADPTKSDYGFVTVSVLPDAADYYIATNGSDSNDGLSPSTPFLTFAKANSVAVAGDVIQVRGGTYTQTHFGTTYSDSGYYGIGLSASGSAGNPITWEPFPGETVVIDCTAIPAYTPGGSYWQYRPSAIHVTGDYVTVKGFEVVGAKSASAEAYEASYTIFDGLYLHDGYGYGVNFWRSDHYTVQGCTILSMDDGGGNADGIHCNQDPADTILGEGLIKDNTIAYIGDDGIDTWGQGGNTIEGNVIHHCGYDAQGNDTAGDANGFKLGGGYADPAYLGQNIVRFNTVYACRNRGLTTNGGSGDSPDNDIYNNTFFNNEGVQVLLRENDNATVRNNIAVNTINYNGTYTAEAGGEATGSGYNTWDFSDEDPLFASTDPASASFMHLSASSPCIGQGTSFSGGDTDLGAHPYP